MKKIQLTGLALATLAACAPAWAQSTVTIYGAVDMSVGKEVPSDLSQLRAGKIGLQSSSGVNLQDSFVGFKGVEDIGGGLQVGFQLEQALDASSGTADPEGAFAHGANIWLGGSWGRFTLGRANTPSYNAMRSWDVMAGGNNSIAIPTYGIVGAEGKRQSNQISYRTPQLGGLAVEAAYVPKDENLRDGVNRSKVDLAATYKVGALTLGGAYNKNSGLDANYGVGAKYQYQNIEVSSAYYSTPSGIYFDPITRMRVPGALFKSNGIVLGAKATWDRFAAGFDIARDTKSEYVVGNSSFDGKKYTNIGLSGAYSFSKRTAAYVVYTRTSDFNNYGVGLSHSF
ncbi:putative porin [Acidovorax sp. 62]|uniref:porin n=1 Tax=Acidovorax sp. 62 TaxID=2035203 RepID=UPI000C4FB53D|nr:porin [Acidovorax sp. 62]PIF92046.1 putative porin [Acidovorax sp. 62]